MVVVKYHAYNASSGRYRPALVNVGSYVQRTQTQLGTATRSSIMHNAALAAGITISAGDGGDVSTDYTRGHTSDSAQQHRVP